MPKSTIEDLKRAWLDQLPMIAALLWEDGDAKEAASHAVELIQACVEEMEEFE